MMDRNHMIESYLDGKLSDEVRGEFERLMRADSVLDREVQAERMIRRTFRNDFTSTGRISSEPSSIILAKLHVTSSIPRAGVVSAGGLANRLFGTPIGLTFITAVGIALVVLSGLVVRSLLPEGDGKDRAAHFGMRPPAGHHVPAIAGEKDSPQLSSDAAGGPASVNSLKENRVILRPLHKRPPSIAAPPMRMASALSFDGNDYIEIGNPPELRLSDALTLEAWVNPRRQYYNAVICKGDAWYGIDLARGLRPGFFFPRLEIDIPDSSFWYWGRLNLLDTIPEGKWTHLACTYDEEVEEINLYVNGVRHASFHARGKLQADSGSLRIGARQPDSALYQEFFKGTLDEIRIWNRARTELEIQEGMNRRLTGNEIGLVGYYSFDQLPGQHAQDLAGEHYGQLGTTPEKDDHDPTWIESRHPDQLDLE